MANSILVVEDDNDLREYLKNILTDSGYSVRVAIEGISALKDMKEVQPDLVLLDLGLPVLGGESVCIEAKKLYPETPIIILTARGTTTDTVKGLNLGADDYIAKPFETDELLARIRARLRSPSLDGEKLKVADLELDTRTMEVRRGDKEIKLTPQEWKLLKYLMENKGRVLTRGMILNRIWLYSPDADTRVVDVYIGYLRKKLDTGFDKRIIHSVRGFGYVIKE